MVLATCPWRRELRSLTSSRRQVQSTSSEEASRINPTARSDNPISTNRWVPAPTHTCIYISSLLWKCARHSRVDRHVFILTVISPCRLWCVRRKRISYYYKLPLFMHQEKLAFLKMWSTVIIKGFCHWLSPDKYGTITSFWKTNTNLKDGYKKYAAFCLQVLIQGIMSQKLIESFKKHLAS